MSEHSYHIQFFEPNDVWPKGGLSVYQINGYQIADRVVLAKIKRPGDGPAYYEGPVIARHSWCGYLGIAPTLEGVVGLIKDTE